MKRSVLIIMLVGVLATLGWLYSTQITNFVLSLMGGEGPKDKINAVATLNEIDKNVTYKRSKEVAWGIGKKELGLEVLDSVSTGADSIAMIGFKVGPVFNLDENSLVVIETPSATVPDLAEVNFSQGTFNAKNDQNADATLKIKSNNVVAETKGKFDFGMAVDKKNKKAQIWVKVGQVKVADNKGNEFIVHENESKEFSTETLEPPPPPPPPTPPPAPEPEKKVEVPQLQEMLTPEDIRRVLTKNKKRIDACYPDAKKNENQQTVNVRLVIMNSGKVIKVNILRSSVHDKKVRACIKWTLKTLVFPKFAGKTDIEDIVLVFR
jgi:hypothetical protein